MQKGMQRIERKQKLGSRRKGDPKQKQHDIPNIGAGEMGGGRAENRNVGCRGYKEGQRNKEMDDGDREWRISQ